MRSYKITTPDRIKAEKVDRQFVWAVNLVVNILCIMGFAYFLYYTGGYKGFIVLYNMVLSLVGGMF